MALFTVEFDIDTSEPGDYNTFIEGLRTRLGVGNPSHGRPVLTPRAIEPTPPTFFDVLLRRTESQPPQALRVRVRTDNLYVIGYRAESSTTWYELAHSSSETLIHDGGTQTEVLRLGYTYSDLEGRSARRSEIPLGQQQLITVVRQLATNTATDSERARGIIVLAEIISEALRFIDISDYIRDSWYNDTPPSPELVALENNWGSLSTAVLRDDLPGHTFDFPPGGGGTTITDLAAAIAAIGILLYRNPNAPSGSRPRRMMAIQASYPEGRELLEIFFVRIDNIDGEDPGDLFGKITATDGLGTENIFNLSDSEYVDIKPGEDALLTGPSRAISAADELIVELDLWDHDTASPNDPIAQGKIEWNSNDYFSKYDTVHNQMISGKYGSATVSYVVMSDALVAEIEVILINGDGEDPANVYGAITAGNGLGESELFRKTSSNYVDVSPHKAIPLSRFVVAVPTKSKLVINADLWDYDSISPDDQIAKGAAEFTPLYKQSEKQEITGSYGEIEVRVTWS